MKIGPSKSVLRVTLLAGLVILSLAFSQTVTWGETTAPEFVFFFSQDTTFLGAPVPVGSVIRAFDPGGAQCGEFEVTTQGQFGNMSCQRDDPITAPDEGPLPGQLISFTIDGLAAAVTPVSLNLTPVSPATPVTWTSMGDLWEVDLKVFGADLSLTKEAVAARDERGHVTFLITVHNAGPDAAPGVKVTDRVPAGLSVRAAHPSQGTFDSSTNVWSVGTIPVGGDATLELVMRVNDPGTFTNVAEVTASQHFDPDSTPDNEVPAEDDQASAIVTLDETMADLSLTKTVNTMRPNVGDNVTFDVEVNNFGPDAATNVEVTDLLPAGLNFVSATPSQGSYNAGTGVWDVGTLGMFDVATLEIVANVTTEGVFENVAEVTASDQADPDSVPGNGQSTEDDQDQATLLVRARR